VSNRTSRGKRQEENPCKAGQMQAQTEEARAIRGCTGRLGQLFAMVNRKAAGIRGAGRGEGRISQRRSAQGEKGKKQNSDGCGAEIEGSHTG